MIRKKYYTITVKKNKIISINKRNCENPFSDSDTKFLLLFVYYWYYKCPIKNRRFQRLKEISFMLCISICRKILYYVICRIYIKLKNMSVYGSK